jgi:hypothetical protein
MAWTGREMCRTDCVVYFNFFVFRRSCFQIFVPLWKSLSVSRQAVLNLGSTDHLRSMEIFQRSVNSDAKKITLFSLTCNWNSDFLVIMKAGNKVMYGRQTATVFVDFSISLYPYFIRLSTFFFWDGFRMFRRTVTGVHGTWKFKNVWSTLRLVEIISLILDINFYFVEITNLILCLIYLMMFQVCNCTSIQGGTTTAWHNRLHFKRRVSRV